jgi:hypothetical protein
LRSELRSGWLGLVRSSGLNESWRDLLAGATSDCQAATRLDSMTSYDVDAHLTDRGWITRATTLNEFGVNEVAFCCELGDESETEEEALLRGARWVLSKGGRVRVVMRAGARVPSAPYVVSSLISDESPAAKGERGGPNITPVCGP